MTTSPLATVPSPRVFAHLRELTLRRRPARSPGTRRYSSTSQASPLKRGGNGLPARLGSGHDLLSYWCEGGVEGRSHRDGVKNERPTMISDQCPLPNAERAWR